MDIVANLTTMNKSLEEENKKLKNIENNDKQEMYALSEDLQAENKFYWESMEKLKEENNKLKEERENASYELAGELEDINTRWAEDKEADRIVIDGLKAKLDDVKEENKDIEGQLVDALISVARLEDIVEEQAEKTDIEYFLKIKELEQTIEELKKSSH